MFILSEVRYESYVFYYFVILLFCYSFRRKRGELKHDKVQYQVA